MKKKRIETIKPRLGINENIKSSSGLIIDAYIAEGILILDFYESYKEKKITIVNPIFRTVLEDRDYANYYFKSGNWDGKMIGNCFESMDFAHILKKRQDFWNPKETELTEGSVEVITKFTERAYGRPLDKIDWKEQEISGNKREKARINHFEKVQQLMKLLPDVEKGFEKYVNETVYGKDHILYFSKESAWCTRCGKEVELKQKKKHNEIGFCPRCKKAVLFKSQSRKSENESRKEVVYIQPVNEDKIVMRYYKTSLLSMVGKKEDLSITESVRTYHGNGLINYQNRYVHYFYNHTDFWTDVMDTYSQVSYGRKSYLYGGNLNQVRLRLQGFEYYPLEEFAKEAEPIPVIRLLGTYPDPIVEMLMKMKLTHLLRDRLNGNYTTRKILAGKTIYQIFGISKIKFNFLKEKNGGCVMLGELQNAEEHNYGLSEEKIFQIVKSGMEYEKLIEASNGHKVMKMFAYLKKTKGYKTLKETVSHYIDYKNMAAELGYDMENDVRKYPNDLKAEHDKMSLEFNKIKNEEKIAKMNEIYQSISEMEQILKETYEYKDGEYIMMAPKSAAEIMEEGKYLHHCVGTERYLKNHAEETSFILFMRKIQDQETPYYTIEFNGEKIVQYYGAHDQKPDKEKVDKFLDKWKAAITRNRVKTA